MADRLLGVGVAGYGLRGRMTRVNMVARAFQRPRYLRRRGDSIMERLHELSLVETDRALASGAATSPEVVAALLERIAAVNPHLNSLLTVMAGAAKQDAAAAHRRRAAGATRGPLDGVPVVLKDLFDVAGVPTTAGSALRAQAVAEADSAVASRLRAAGAVILGKSHTHEWALGTTSNNPHFGPARNPWDTDRIPGGSSGGNAAGLAARLFAGAVGSDTGGSVRIPAALCGVVGLKPTRGLVSLRGVVPLSWSLDHAGPMARTAEDAALLLDAIAGFDAGDPASRRPPEGPPVAPGLRGDPRGLAIGIPADYFWDEVVPEVAALCRQAVAVLEDAGARIVEVPPLGWRAAARASGRILLADAAAYHQATLAENAVAYGADVRARLETGLGLAGVDVARARREMDVWRRRLEDLFGHVDLLATPTTGNTAEPIAGIEGVAAAASLTARTSPFNLTGLPAASVPCGFTAAGLPVGLQLVGREWQEATVLRAAAAYQAVTDWHLRVPPVAAVTPPQGQH